MLLDKSWMNKRGTADYIIGVQTFIDFVRKNANGRSCFPCPCTHCKNCRGQMDVDIINLHLLQNGIQQNYVFWRHHGEKENFSEESIPISKSIDAQEAENLSNPRLENLINDVYNVHMNEVEFAPDDVDGVENEIPRPNVQESNKYRFFKEMASEPLYTGCPEGKTVLSTIIELQNLKARYGWTGISVTALLEWLQTLFKDGSKLPKNYPNMKNMIKDLGMECETIHACKNGCILYRKEYENLNKCPKCGFGRYKLAIGDEIRTTKKFRKEPAKFVKYFPLIPRLKRFFSIPWIGEAMTWHQKANSDGNLMRHPCDSAQWDSVKINWPEFAADARNIRLAISTDGFNPHATLSSTYSCWPVILAPLNLPPSLCMKREFCLLSLLISGPKGPGKNFDIFLQPLLEELQVLWENGVLTWDAFTKSTFRMKAMLLWGVHDFPAYGIMSGCTVHGYKACPVCANDIDSTRLGDSSSVYYHGYRRFLKLDHKFRNDKRFNKKIEIRTPPRRLSGAEVEQKVVVTLEKNERKRLKKIACGKRRRKISIESTAVDEEGTSEDESTHVAPWSRRSILFNLPYWKFLEVRHNIDVMHTEKNVTEHILNTLMSVKNKSKDVIQGRKEFKKLGVKKNMWVVEDEETRKISMPKLPYTLSKKEKFEFCEVLKNLKLPTSFSSNLSKCVSVQPPELRGLKSHDYHVIMQLLPVLFRNSFQNNKGIRNVIQRISLFFKILCAKVINKEELKQAQKALVEALCILEKEFPPSFFVISVHLMIHLSEEAIACGPVRFRWMYPFERYI